MLFSHDCGDDHKEIIISIERVARQEEVAFFFRFYRLAGFAARLHKMDKGDSTLGFPDELNKFSDDAFGANLGLNLV